MASWDDWPLSCSGSDEEVPEAIRHNPEEPHSQATSAHHAPQTHPHTEGPSLERHQAQQPGPQGVLPNVRQMLGDTAAPKRLGRRSALLTEIVRDFRSRGAPEQVARSRAQILQQAREAKAQKKLARTGGSSQPSLA